MSRVLIRVLTEFLPVFSTVLSAFVSHQCPKFQWATIKNISVTAEAGQITPGNAHVTGRNGRFYANRRFTD
jgi:hypothetical protein